ncbi:MAG: TssQ family T6SS-associated lipoprotein [Methyloversatilis sp.]|jgi:hypothetical protein|nr:TssQ family T6SS-associated lipoprotein [Methyloversatilis sp.]MBP6195465.1 TssQ family T6SS-associated lipoprotein [Methyloversatilis sp.]MBP9117008.1 TssQ family T6SS-associated lipoprotein [Methyloversatilis sp.]
MNSARRSAPPVAGWRAFAALCAVLLLTGCAAVQKRVDEVVTALKPEPSQPQPQSKPRATPTTASAPPPAPAKPAAVPARTPEDLLAAGVAQYEDGRYTQATELLKASLAGGLRSRAGQARAHKHLAFIHCISDRESACRQSFGNALAADPEFALTAAESGHPKWGPVYRSVIQGR